MFWSRDRATALRKKRGNRRIGPSHQPILMVSARMVEQKQARAHKVGAIVLLVAVLAGTAWLAVAATDFFERKLFSECGRFVIKQLDLSSDGKLQPWHIKEYAGLEEGMNLFALDLEKIRQDLASVPIVSTVRVTRRLPDTLEVRITERVAVARLGRADVNYLLGLDREGYVLGPSAISPNLPLITGLRDKGLRPGSKVTDPSVVDALRLIESCDEVSLSSFIRIQDVGVAHGDYLDLKLVRGERVLLSREHMEVKLQKLARILQSSSKKGITLASIDMTVDKNFPGTPP